MRHHSVILDVLARCNSRPIIWSRKAISIHPNCDHNSGWFMLTVSLRGIGRICFGLLIHKITMSDSASFSASANFVLRTLKAWKKLCIQHQPFHSLDTFWWFKRIFDCYGHRYSWFAYLFHLVENYFQLEIPSDILSIYWIQFSYYLSGVYMELFMDKRRKDSTLMLSHHFVTLTLMYFSFLTRWVLSF